MCQRSGGAASVLCLCTIRVVIKSPVVRLFDLLAQLHSTGLSARAQATAAGGRVDGRQLHHLRFADDIVLITPSMEVKVDGRQLHHLRFADDIVLITPSISSRRPATAPSSLR
ncbi:unnamed protein product [Heligmosomoides polygyrus]|uniref:Reverse transcriptase domain-containing protein n=1 Tax=Heligmosomoides polygyrus TaxID=6339 RepID=A0A183FGS5_HELPZ|nr:unnamed protein product [Heligmosomoides polygyrus]